MSGDDNEFRIRPGKPRSTRAPRTKTFINQVLRVQNWSCISFWLTLLSYVNKVGHIADSLDDIRFIAFIARP